MRKIDSDLFSIDIKKTRIYSSWTKDISIVDKSDVYIYHISRDIRISGIVVGWISVYLIDRYGRRVLMAVSCGCVIIGMMLLGLHFMLLEQNFDSKNLEWLPILAMIFYVMISIGLIPVPSTVLGEFFPDDLKSIAGFAVSITSALFAFVSSATYQPMIDLTSEKYVYWMYAMVMIVCMIYSFVEIPETKGKTLQVIFESI